MSASPRAAVAALAAATLVLVSAFAGSGAVPAAASVAPTPTAQQSSTQPSTAAAAGNVRVSLAVDEADGDPATGDHVTWRNEDTGHGTTATTDSAGRANATLTAGVGYEVVFEQHGATEFPKDGVPDLYAVGTRTYAADDASNLALPRAHNLTVTVRDEAGARCRTPPSTSPAAATARPPS